MTIVKFIKGLGLNLMEPSTAILKPMVEIVWKVNISHIMKIDVSHCLITFVIYLGYKAQMLPEYFLNYYLHNGNVTIGCRNSFGTSFIVFS